MIYLAIGISFVLFSIAVFLFYKIFQERKEIDREKIKIREDYLSKEKKMANLKEKERVFLMDLEKIKQKELEKINSETIKRTEEMQSALNDMRLKQENEIKEEIEQKKKEELEKLSKQLEEQKAELTASHQEKIEKIQSELESLRSMESAARMARIRDLNEQNEKTWHMLDLSKEDLIELKELDAIKLRNPLPLRKAIYDIYYREPTRALINRVLNNESFSGIYKITLLSTGQCYVGKSVDLRRRWTDHIRRGVGADNPTQMIVYDAFKEHGLHNFTFEVVEKVDAAELNERERYWIEYFGSKVFGYNMRG